MLRYKILNGRIRHKLFTILAILCVLTACNSATPKQERESEADNTLQANGRKANVVRRQLSTLKEFTHLTNLGSVNIIYTQGDYSMEVEGDSTMLQYLVTSFDSNLLTVSMRSDGNKNINLYGNTSNVTMYLSCPNMKCVSICGNGGFESIGKWSGDDIEVGILSTGTMRLDTIECNTFSMQSTSVSLVSIANLKAQEATIMTRTNATVDMNVDVEDLTILNDGKPKMTLAGKATNLLIKNPKDEEFVNLIK